MQFYLFFKLEMSLMYRITLVSGVQHSDQHFTTISLITIRPHTKL